MFKKISGLIAAASVLFCTTASASLIVDTVGVSGSGTTTWTLSGSSTTNQSGTIRTSVGSSSFSIGDTFEPDVTGDFLNNVAIQNLLFAIVGAPTITVGGTTQTVTHIFLDEDGVGSRDDFGIRTDAVLNYAAQQISSWAGSFTVALDIDDFNLGSYRLNTAQTNGGGFLFAGVNDVILNFSDSSAVPAPATLALFGLGLAGLGWSRRKKA